MNNLTDFTNSIFEHIKHVNQDGAEYWLASELQPGLGYASWRTFERVINKAKMACINSGFVLENHFDASIKMIEVGSGAQREIADINLSRYACYLIVQNADPRKEVIAFAKTYFAIQTRKREIAEEHQDYGYMGLYGGLKAKDIRVRKGLKPSQDILDHMGSEELAANLFRSTQTNAKLKRENVHSKEAANQTHFEVGQTVRKTIQDLGGDMPEDLPAPEKSIQEIEAEKRKRLNS